MSIVSNASISSDSGGRLPECFRGPSRGRKPGASIHGRIYGVSEGAALAGGRSGRLRRLDGPPFRWGEDRRFLLRAELDAAFFLLYLPAGPNGDWVPARKADGCPYDETPEQLEQLKKSLPMPRDAVSYIMDTFPIVKRKDEAAFGSYRTKEMILAIFDEMQESIRTGTDYRTKLSPEPGNRAYCHPAMAERKH